MFTKREHVKVLAKNVVSRLEQDQSILLNPRTRNNVYQDLYLKISPFVLTDEEIRERVLKDIGLKAEELSESAYTESDQYRAAKNVLMGKIGENAVAGLYYQQPVRNVAQMIGHFLMNHLHVEDVFSSDEELEKVVVDFLKKFNPAQLH
ncbi:MAG: DUF507 family protein [Bdellovibrionales bacterium]|nr:DUF507 family protein [Bdellovibrionales bacterium]